MSLTPILAAFDPASFSKLVESVVESLGYFRAELQVVGGALAIILVDLFLPLKASRHLAWLAIIACLVPAYTLTVPHAEPSSSRLFLGMVSYDSFSTFYKLLFLLGSIPVIVLTYIATPLRGRRMGEFYGILLASVFGAMLLASSTHFLMVFLSLELLSFSSYILVGYRRQDRLGVEASLKYIIYGSVASAIMLFGMSLYFGLTGSADLGELASVVRGEVAEGNAAFVGTTALISLLLIFVGIAYKISTIPMHFWAPDAYEGAPTPVTAFLAVLSKAAGFALALRFFQSLVDTVGALAPDSLAYEIWSKYIGVPGSSPWLIVLIVISIVTMTVGNLAALWQTNLKRLFAYSSIAHAGYMMMGLTILHTGASAGDIGGASIGGIEAISFYLVAYLAMNFGAFAIIVLIENRTGSCELSAYAGLGRRSPLLAVSMVVFLFSLIGLPPTAGFTGKLQLFMGVLDVARPEYYVLAVAAAINTAISAYYYLKIAREMYFSDQRGDYGELRLHALGKALVAAMVILTFWLFFRAQDVLDTTRVLTLEI
ncbi:MAG TPA: NADH-quinone oxidoreductase subunit N [Planctomycetota bacterium]|nr:NADH-quinone oxidoreductase subunit N [Planctomycetota bacterium]